MPSPLFPIPAQQAADEPLWAPLLTGTTTIFGREYGQPPIVAIPVFLGVLALASFVVERTAAWFIGRVAAKTETKVDDVFAEGLPNVVRLALVFIALKVIVHALLPGASSAKEAAGQTAATTSPGEPPAVLWGRAVTAIGIVVVGIALTRLLLRMTDAWADAKEHRRPIGPGIKLALKVAAIPVLVVLSLHAAGVEIAPLLTVLGVGSLAVALALQDVLKNIFSGIQLVIDQPVRAGDFIVLDDGRVRGTVLEIGLRSTKLRTVENNVVILPNTNLANAVVTNMDMIERAYAHVIKVGVAYGTDARRVQQVLQDEADRAGKEVPGCLDEPAKVQFSEMADSALVFRVVVRLKQYAGLYDPIAELNHRIYERLRREGIEIPYPTRTVIVRQDPPPAPDASAAATSPPALPGA